MRKLLSAKVSFQWSQECEEEFTALKKILTSPLFLRPFDSSLETTFSVDTSNLEGTGFLLSQEDKEGKTRVVRCGSVAAKKSWKSLSPIEAEAVGICWSARSLDYYLRGAPKVRCIIDHRPLQTLMTAPLESLSPRMLRARLELLPYRIEFIWVPGCHHQICDALGRRPVYQSWKNLPEPMSNLTEDLPIHHVISNVTGLDDYLGIEVTDKVKAAIKSDPNYQAILEKVGEVSRKEIGNLPRAHPARELQSIWGLCSKVTVGEGEESVQVILVDNTRLYIPTSERASVLSLLHQSHTGINRTTEAAKHLFFWRAMKEQIAKMISACDICIKYQPSKPQIEEVKKVSPSTHPLHRVCLDLFTYNSSQYSILVDEYSGYFWIQRFKGTPTTDQLTKYLGTLFLETGVPSYLCTDDGGSMRGRFEMWCNDLGVVVEKSSAFNPISNGTAERHIQVAKRMLDISKEQKIPVEESRARLLSSPSSIDGFSPSRLYFGRELRNPQLPSIPDGQEEELLGKQRQVTKDDDRIKRNSKVGKSLPRYEPKVGDLVLLQNQRTKRWDVPATVHLVRPGNRSAYVVAEDDGTMYLRSHTFLRLRQDPAIDAATSADPGSVSSTSDDTAPGPVTRSRAVANTSIVRHSYGKPPPRNLIAQLALSCTEEPGQSTSEKAPRKKVRFFLDCEHTDSTSDKRDVTCKGYSTKAGLLFDCCCRQSTSSHAYCLPTNREDDVQDQDHPHLPHQPGSLGHGCGPRHQTPRHQF